MTPELIRRIGEESGETMALYRVSTSQCELVTYGEEYTIDAGRRFTRRVTEEEGQREIDHAITQWYLDIVTGDLVPGAWEEDLSGPR